MKQSNENGVIKTRNRKSLAELRAPRQKFIARWRREFPWLQPNRADESIGLCTICNQELVCKTSHLDRHQKTFKHTRLAKIENVTTNFELIPEADLIEAHTSGYLDSEQDFSNHDELSFADETMEYTTIKVEPIKIDDSNELVEPLEPVIKQKSPVRRRRKAKAKTESPLMFEAIETAEFEPNFSNSSQKSLKTEPGLNSSKRSDQSICDYYYMHPPPAKDSFDLFFESISATVKSFPPKLAAELKGRVSQLITEFELRSICEKEAQEKAITQQSVTVLSGSVVEGEESPLLVVKYPQV